MSYGNALIPFSKEFASKNPDSFCLKLQNCKIASINTVLSKNEVLATTATMNMRKKSTLSSVVDRRRKFGDALRAKGSNFGQFFLCET